MLNHIRIDINFIAFCLLLFCHGLNNIHIRAMDFYAITINFTLFNRWMKKVSVIFLFL